MIFDLDVDSCLHYIPAIKLFVEIYSLQGRLVCALTCVVCSTQFQLLLFIHCIALDLDLFVPLKYYGSRYL